MRHFPMQYVNGDSVRRSRQCLHGTFRLAAAVALLSLGWVPAVCAQDAVTIKIKSTGASPITPGFSGFNTPQPRNGVEYYDPKFIAAVTPLKPGWVRYPAGTASMDFDWTIGETNAVWMNSLVDGNPPAVTGQPANILTTSAPLTQAKGGVLFSDFATFASTLKASAIICFNSFTDVNPGSATQMALTAQSYGLNVLEWELGNEAYVYPLLYPTTADYATASNSYFNEILTGAPTATVGLFPAGWYAGTGNCQNPPAAPQPCYPSWDSGFSSYTPQYWNAVSNHIYPIVANQSTQNTILALNGILANGSTDYINSYLIPLVGASTPIFITEFNCCTQDDSLFLTYLYDGIFMAEYIARLSTVPNVKAVGVNALYTDNSDNHGLIRAVNDYESYLLAQIAENPNYSTNTATNPNTQFQFYHSAPGLAMQVANTAINSGTQIWPTTVSGGSTVASSGFNGSRIPAVYAQTYIAASGRHYLLITNKSSSAQTATVVLNGVTVQATLNLEYVSNSSPSAANTAQSPNTIKIQTATSSNPIQVAPYSVTTVWW
ncbi:MAG TPA: hypothetical protein VN924_01850 [Bryobacteraceae bacterium]|nr:hypothetical protein [Bryobacteraceae bacterium]